MATKTKNASTSPITPKKKSPAPTKKNAPAPTKKNAPAPENAKKKNAPPRKALKKGQTTAVAKVTRLIADAKVAKSGKVKRAEALLNLIARRKSRISEDFYEIGKALKELLTKKLYLDLGYDSFEALLVARDVMSVTQAAKLIEVVSSVPLATALPLGPEKAFALTKYADATPEPDTAQSLVESGAKLGDKPIAEASKNEINEAAKQLRRAAAPKGAKKKKSPAQREAEALAKKTGAWLSKRGIRKHHVEAKQTGAGLVVTIAMPLAAAAALVAT